MYSNQENSQDTERRCAERVDVSFPVECSVLNDKNYFYTVSKDLSTSGLKIIAEKFLAKNSELKINLNLIKKVIQLKGRVVWCNKIRVAERYSAGIQFVEVSKGCKDNLADFFSEINI